MKRLPVWLVGCGISVIGLAVPIGHAENTIEVEMYEVSEDGRGDAIGKVSLRKHSDGVLIDPALEGIGPGLHGFHLHQNPDCGPGQKDGQPAAAIAAGGHYDPDDANAHRGPYDPDGHLGDLPALYADQDGEVSQPVLAPRLQLRDLPGRALVVHEGGDNYSDEPESLGGGGSRIACGVIPSG